jgi:hypothetical protein
LGDLNLRPPDRAYVLAERNSTVGYGTGRSIGGRKLQKTRLVEGDWELVRTDYDHLETANDGQGSKRISRIGIEGEKQETNGRTVADTEIGV